MFNITITVPRVGGFIEAVKRRFRADVTKRLHGQVADLRERLSKSIRASLKAHRTYESLTEDGGSLRKELGLGDSQQILVARCVDYIADAVRVDVLPGTGDVAATLRFVLLSEGLTELVARPFASYVSYGRPRKNSRKRRRSEDDYEDGGDDDGPRVVDWLDWLLTRGSQIVITTHFIHFVTSPASRTGTALMIQGGSGGWGLPHGVGGTPGSNWVEDTLRKVAADAREIFAVIVKRALG